MSKLEKNNHQISGGKMKQKSDKVIVRVVDKLPEDIMLGNPKNDTIGDSYRRNYLKNFPYIVADNIAAIFEKQSPDNVYLLEYIFNGAMDSYIYNRAEEKRILAKVKQILLLRYDLNLLNTSLKEPLKISDLKGNVKEYSTK